MKHLTKILGITLYAFLIMGCVNDDDILNGRFDYFWTFKLDGVPVELKGVGITNGLISDSQVYIFAMNAVNDYTATVDEIFYLSFAQESSELLLNHDYVINYATIARDFEDDPQAWGIASGGHIAYYIDNNGVQYTASPQQDFELFNKVTGYSIRFTSKSADAVEGVFSAKLYNRDLDKFIEITEGKFRLLSALNRN